jgi:luciferase-like monooxygenase
VAGALARLYAASKTRLSGLRFGPSRFGHGEAIWLGNREIAHLHSRARVDVRLHGRLQREAAILGAPGRKRRANWIEVLVRGDTDARLLARLLVLEYGPRN